MVEFAGCHAVAGHVQFAHPAFELVVKTVQGPTTRGQNYRVRRRVLDLPGIDVFYRHALRFDCGHPAVLRA